MALLKVTSPKGAAPKQDDDDSSHRLRQLIGYIGLVFPLILIYVVIQRDGLGVWRELDSVSAYYYSGANAVFIGMLVTLALFLLAYDGYKNKAQWADRWLSNLAALAALGVAFFPTGAPGKMGGSCVLTPTVDGVCALAWWEPWVGVVHFVCAGVLFGIFAVFCLWLFRKKADEKEADPDKRNRNTVYLICGIVIVFCIVWAIYEGRAGRSIFWAESVALVFFAISWLVKGYALKSIRAVARSLLAPKPEAIEEEDFSKRGGR